MTEIEKNIIKNEILGEILVESREITQLTAVEKIKDTDCVELDGGRYTSLLRLKNYFGVGGANIDILQNWADYTADKAGYALSALLGWDLYQNKVDKVAGKGLSENDFTTALLNKLNGIETGANKYVHPTDGANKTIAAASKRVLSSITVDLLGHVTAVDYKALSASDIPNLDWSKITSGKPTTLAGYGITDAFTKTEADGRYVNVTGDTMTGLLTLNAGAKIISGQKLIIGDCEITWDATNGGLKFSQSIYSEGGVTALGQGGVSGGSTGSGLSYQRLDNWSDYTTGKAGHVLSAGLGWDLHTRVNNVYTKAEADGKYQPKGSYLTGITKAMVEAVLTGTITSHTHSSLVSKGNIAPQTGRTQSLGNVYTYNTAGSALVADAPANYISVIGFGRGTSGTVEIAGRWTAGMGLWYRSLRDTIDDWYDWIQILDANNTKIDNGVITINGASITPALSVHTHSDYVTLDTPQTITGAKTLDANVNLSATRSIDLKNETATIVKTSQQSIHGGKDMAGSTDANLRFGSWYGIGWYPTIANQTVPQGENAMWLNVRNGDLTVRGKFIKKDGTSSQFLKADGSVDSNSYALASALDNYYTKTTADGRYIYHRRVSSTVAFNVDEITGNTGGLYEINKALGTLPFNSSWYKLFDWGTGDLQYRVQMMTSYIGNDSLYLRHKRSGSWDAWRTILDSVNYENILNGTYVNVTGDTMTGILNVPDIYISSTNGGIGSNLTTDNFFGPQGASNNAILLGRSNARWSNVYSVLGNFSDRVTVKALTISDTAGTEHIKFSRGNYNYITAPSDGVFGFITNGKSTGEVYSDLVIAPDQVRPGSNDKVYLGTSTRRWKNLYSVLGNFTGLITASNAGIKIGEATISWDANAQALKIDKSVYSEGGVTALGQGGVSGGSTGGGSVPILQEWTNYAAASAKQTALSAYLGYDLYTNAVQSLSATGTGNAVTDVTKNGAAITITKGATFSLSDHNHGLLHHDLGVTLENTTTDSGWSMINPTYRGFILKSIRTQGSAPSWIMENCSAGICFGGLDTKGVMSVAYTTPKIRFAGGNGDAPKWYLTLMGTTATTYNLDNFALTSALSGYLPLSGGTLTGLLTAKVGTTHTGIKLGDTYLTAINGRVIFQNNSEIRFGGDSWDYNVWAGLKYNHSVKSIYLGLAGNDAFEANATQSGGKILTPGIDNIYVGNNTTNKVWHAGNDGAGSGLDADMIDGKHLSSLFRILDFNLDLNDQADSNNNNGIVYINYNSPGWSSDIHPFWYGSGLNLSAGVASTQIQFPSTNDEPFYRVRWWSGNNGAWKEWKRLAFLSSNVASATKLQTARKLWGQNFNGEGDVSGDMSSVGNITFNNSDNGRQLSILTSGSLRFKGATGGWAWGLYSRGNDNTTDLGCSAGAYGTTNALNYYFYGGDWNSPKMVILPNGNVGIGTTNPGYKLDVRGEVRSTSANAFRATHQLSTNEDCGLILRNDGNNSYFLLTDPGNRDGGFNDLRPFRIHNSTGNLYLGNSALNVIHGGNVGIGTTSPAHKLDVNGTIRSKATYAFRATGGNYGFIIYNEGGYTNFLLTNSGDVDGKFNDLRPFSINNATGRVSMNCGLTVGCGDANLAVYQAANPNNNSAYGSETLVLQSCFDNQDPITSTYPSSWPSRAIIALQPRGGRVAIGKLFADADLDVKSSVKIGSILLEDVNGDLKINGNVYATGGVTALGQGGATGGSSGTGSSYGLMRTWPTSDPGPNTDNALGANLGWELYQNKLNATKAAIEGLLTGTITSHTHSSLVSKGNIAPQTGRTQSLGNVYTYNTAGSALVADAPANYISVIGFGRGTSGTVEIAGRWTAGMGLWYRSLRDTIDDWYDWIQILDANNTKIDNGVITINGASITPVDLTSAQTISGVKTFSAKTYFTNGGLYGQPGPENHGIRLGISGRDYCDFLEYGAVWNFKKANNGTETLVASITESGVSAAGLILGTAGTGAPTETVDKNLITLHPVAHTGGPWYINVQDTTTEANLRILYNSTVRCTFGASGVTALAFMKVGGTNTQFLMAGGGVKALSDITSAYVTEVGVGTGDNANKLSWTKNGTTNYITVPFATKANYLMNNSALTYGASGVQWFNISGTAGCVAKVNDTPTTAWWHILRFNHSNATGYYTDLAVPFNANSLYYKRINAGSLKNDHWVKLLDDLNYSDVCDNRYYTKTASDGRFVSLTANQVVKGGKMFRAGFMHIQRDNGTDNGGRGIAIYPQEDTNTGNRALGISVLNATGEWGAGCLNIYANGDVEFSHDVTVANLLSNGGVTALDSSDRRLKENFSYGEDYCERLMKLGAVVDFNYNALEVKRSKGRHRRDIRHTSVIYQEAVKAEIPGFCHLGADGYGSVNFLSPDLLGTMLGAEQQLIRRVKDLEREVRELRGQLATHYNQT